MKRPAAAISAIAILGLLVLVTSLARPASAAGLATAPGAAGAQRTGYQAIDCTPGPNKILTGCVYDGMDINGANFSGSDLTGATFNGANVSGSNFSNANLTVATLNGANLSCSNFNGANLTSTTLDGANLFGSTFDGALFVTPTFGTTTTCPDGSTSGDNGGTCVNNLGSAGCGVVATSTPIPESTSTSTPVPPSTATNTPVPASTETSTPVPGGGGVPTIAPPGGSTPTPTETSLQQTPGVTVTGTPDSILRFPNTGAGPGQQGMNPTGQLLAIVTTIGVLGGLASRLASRRATLDVR